MGHRINKQQGNEMRKPTSTSSPENEIFQEVKRILGLTDIFAWTVNHTKKYNSFSHAGLSALQIAEKMKTL
jgi:hypothetical protein